MAKSRPSPQPKENPPSGSTPIILIAGAVIVIALVAFSFTRALRTPAAAVTAPSVAQTTAPATPEQQPAAPQADQEPALPSAASPRASVDTAMPLNAVPSPMDAPPTQAQIASVPRIEAGDLLKKLENKQVTVIDVRDADSYRARHIPGALHIPLSFIAGEVPYLPKDKPIVTYCT